MILAKTQTPGLGDGVSAFFERCGFSPGAQAQCWTLAQELFPGARIEEAMPQGYCSYTLCIGHDRVVQFRPPAHKLRMSLADAACDVYGELAPRTQLLATLKPGPYSSSNDYGKETHRPEPVDEGVVIEVDQHCLDVVSMARLEGRSLSELRVSSAMLLSPCAAEKQHRSVICQFARIVATSMRQPRRNADIEGSDLGGRVGGSIRWRLKQMHEHLPGRFRCATSSALNNLDEIVSLPWVLTHGDLVPANIMVEPSKSISGELVLTGLLDWAEAEYLPFGVGLYGLEELLGGVDTGGRFSYYPSAEELRILFWTHLEAELGGAGFVLTECSKAVIGAAHALGVLLWHGIAFDDGRLDRVVQAGVDDEELLRLDLFFAGHGLVDGQSGDTPLHLVH